MKKIFFFQFLIFFTYYPCLCNAKNNCDILFKKQDQIISEINEKVTSKKLNKKEIKTELERQIAGINCALNQKKIKYDFSILFDQKTILEEINDFDCSLNSEAIKLRINSTGATSEYYDLPEASAAEEIVKSLCKQ